MVLVRGRSLAVLLDAESDWLLAGWNHLGRGVLLDLV
jgi:hypothetical protein